MVSDGDAPAPFVQAGYDPPTSTYRAQHDWEDESPLYFTVLSTVSAVVDTEPHEIEQLANIVDPDALEDLFNRGMESGHPSDDVRFTIEGCDVIVRRDGRITVHPPEQN